MLISLDQTAAKRLGGGCMFVIGCAVQSLRNSNLLNVVISSYLIQGA